MRSNGLWEKGACLAGRALLAAVAAAALAGCAGRDFVRPSEGTYQLGTTRVDTVLSQLGAPNREGTLTKNDKTIRMFSHAYAATGGEALYPGVVPARAYGTYFLDDVLVGYEFVSSFKTDGTDFDDTKVSSIVKGKTTAGEVTTLLGPPAGRWMYPLIDGPADRAIVYIYTQVTGTAFNLKVFRKVLLVSYNPSTDLVTDVKLESSGQK